MIPASERAKTVDALDLSATVTGIQLYRQGKSIFVSHEMGLYILIQYLEDNLMSP
jgi:hypothetical protein